MYASVSCSGMNGEVTMEYPRAHLVHCLHMHVQSAISHSRLEDSIQKKLHKLNNRINWDFLNVKNKHTGRSIWHRKNSAHKSMRYMCIAFPCL